MSDIRIEKTKENIQNAFFTILDFDKYNDMTVNQICQYARCSRSTFYAYYESKDQLLNEIIESYMNRCRHYIVQKFIPHSDFQKIFSKLMTDVVIPEKENVSKLFHIDLNGEGFQKQFEDLCKEIFIEHYPKITSRDIVAELYSACTVKVLKAIVDERLTEADIKVIHKLQGSVFKLIS